MAKFIEHAKMFECAECGKEKYVPVPEDWIYKRLRTRNRKKRQEWYCSWHCMRKSDKEYEASKQRKLNQYV